MHLSLCVSLQEARNIEEFGRNFADDPTVKIPWVRRDLCGSKVVVMEWIEGIRCTDINGIRTSGIDIDEFIRCVLEGMFCRGIRQSAS